MRARALTYRPLPPGASPSASAPLCLSVLTEVLLNPTGARLLGAFLQTKLNLGLYKDYRVSAQTISSTYSSKIKRFKH